ncbi:MAG: AEC family transporter [Spirochaeta sp.]|nr:AEC family transporter [Spirochaeta sp.]
MAFDIISAVGRLVLLCLFGFVVFQPAALRDRLLRPIVFVTINGVFPLYFVHHFPTSWADAVDAGGHWMVVFFFACIFYIALQATIGRLLLSKVPALKTVEHPREYLAMFAMQNAGYIPLPILAVIAPRVVLLYMFFFTFAFNILFWSFAVSYIQGHGSGFRFRMNVPMIGLTAGLLFAMSGTYGYVPEFLREALALNASVAMDLVLIVLGGTLASIPRDSLRYRAEFAWFIGLRQVAYPAVFLLVLWLVPLPGLSGELEWGIRVAFLLQAVTPPATNLLLVTKEYGTEEQVNYGGSLILYSYMASALTIPAFLILARILFS